MDIFWDKTVRILKEKVSQQNFETWIHPIRITTMEGNLVHLRVPNRFFRDWLVENYLALIRESMKSAAGISFQIEWIIEQDNNQMVGSSGDTAAAEKTAPKKPSRSRIHSSLNVNYSFDRFVVGSCNQFAHAASAAVAEQPAKNYNPLFIYGGVGLGKTHLLNAIGLKTLTLFPDM
ncbi:MAG: DnaA/Hda family protein, partial [Smithella sp.]